MMDCLDVGGPTQASLWTWFGVGPKYEIERGFVVGNAGLEPATPCV